MTSIPGYTTATFSFACRRCSPARATKIFSPCSPTAGVPPDRLSTLLRLLGLSLPTYVFRRTFTKIRRVLPSGIMPSLPSPPSFSSPAAPTCRSPPFVVTTHPGGHGRLGVCFNVNLGRCTSALNSWTAAFATNRHRAADRDEAVRPTPSWGLEPVLASEQAAESPTMAWIGDTPAPHRDAARGLLQVLGDNPLEKNRSWGLGKK